MLTRNRLLLSITLIILFLLTLACNGATPIYATIIDFQEGPPARGNQTMIVTVDKGTQQGVSQSHMGWLRYHKAAIMEMTIIDVGATSSTLQSFYYPDVKVGQQVLIIERGVDEERIFQLTEKLIPEPQAEDSGSDEKQTPEPQAEDNGNEEKQTSTLSPEDRENNNNRVLSQYFPKYKDSDFPEMQAVVSQYKAFIPQTIPDTLDLASTWAAAMSIEEVGTTWSHHENINFATLVDLCLSMNYVYDKIIGTKAISDIDIAQRMSQIAVNARNAGLKYKDAMDYDKALYKLEKAALISEHVLFDVPVGKNPLTAQIYRDIGQVYAKMGHQDKAIDYYDKANKLDPD